MKKKNGLLQTFFYDFFENSSDELGTANTRHLRKSIFNNLLIFVTVHSDYLGAKKIASSRFQSPIKKTNRKLRHWRPTARSLPVFNNKNPHRNKFYMGCRQVFTTSFSLPKYINNINHITQNIHINFNKKKAKQNCVRKL